MEILVVVGTLSGLGGIETCVRTLSEEADAHGDRVRVLALCPSVLDDRWHQGLRYTEVADASRSLKWQMLRGLPAVVSACRQHPPDVVVVIYGSSVPMVRAALWLAGLQRPVMAWLHFTTAHAQRTSMLRYAHGHLCISKQIAEATLELPGVEAENVHLVYNGVKFNQAALLPRSSSGPLRMMHVGRLMMGRQKRTDDLLRALTRVPGDWQLDLVGRAESDAEIAHLRTLADELGIAGRIRWLGWQADPWGAVGTADLLVMCSAFEGFPMVMIEAMARGVPCVSSDCPSGPSDIVQPGRNGSLFPVGDLEALAGTLRRLVADRGLLPAPAAVRDSALRFSSDRVFGRIKHAVEQTIAQFGREHGLTERG